MLRRILHTALIICFAGVATGAPDIEEWPLSVPNSNTPKKLREAWLSFHDIGLCQEVDALFVFNENGMEVWSRIEKDKDRRKFLKLFESLGNSYPIDLYTTRPSDEDKEGFEEPPPSLWQNYELRSNLGDRIGLVFSRLDLEERLHLEPPPVDPSLKQRLIIYAEQTLNWNKRLRQYALDLPALARSASDSGAPSDQKTMAWIVCSDHARNLEKCIEKLADSLKQAIPVVGKIKRSPAHRDPAVRKGEDPVDRAMQISVAADSVSRRVYHFIHPEHFTVELDELRNPSLLESLWELRAMVEDFERSLPLHAGK